MATRDSEAFSSESLGGRSLVGIALVVFAVAFAGSWVWHRDSVIYDTDSYFHLAVAGIYSEQGVHASPPLRGSLLGPRADGGGFGDKEWLFHVGLVPFLRVFDDPLVAGRVAVATCVGWLVAMLAAVAARAVGPWGALVPFALIVTSTPWAWRLVRLRPELLALGLVIAALWAYAERRERLLGGLTAIYALTYTAIHSLVGLIALCAVAEGWVERRWPIRAVLYTLLGAALGLWLHPHFPTNLEIWSLQNVRYFVLTGVLDVPDELEPVTTKAALIAHLGWLAGLVVLARAARPGPPADAVERRLALGLAIGCASLGSLYLLMGRFVFYAVPLATLACLYELRRRGLVIGSRVRLPGRGSLPLALAIVLCLAISWPEAMRQLRLYHAETSLGPDRARLVDRERLAAAIPHGARVAADWAPTATYLLWAPHGRYLNALDPSFLAIPSPEVHRALRRVLEAREPDVPAAMVGVLDSDHLAFPVAGHERLIERLAGDPRVTVLHRGADWLVRVAPVDGFALDWRFAPSDIAMPITPTTLASWVPYPRSPDPAVRAIEGFVDLDRPTSAASCRTLVRPATEVADSTIEISSAGALTVWLGERRLVALGRGSDAILGGGVTLRVPPGADDELWRVSSCRGPDGSNGFYWRSTMGSTEVRTSTVPRG